MFSASRLESLAVGRTADGHAAGFWDVLGEARRTEQLHQRSAGLPLKWPPDPVEFRSAVNGVAGGAAPDRGLHDRGVAKLQSSLAAICRSVNPCCSSWTSAILRSFICSRFAAMYRLLPDALRYASADKIR